MCKRKVKCVKGKGSCRIVGNEENSDGYFNRIFHRGPLCIGSYFYRTSLLHLGP